MTTAPGTANRPIRILVMCTANRGRSPIAEELLKRAFAARGLSDVIQVESAGLSTHELGRSGMPVGENVARVARAHDIDLSRHRARPLDPKTFSSYDMAIVMEAWQAQALREVFANAKTSIHTLRELAGGYADQTTPDVAGMPDVALHAYVEEAKVCLAAALSAGPLADLIATRKEPRP